MNNLSLAATLLISAGGLMMCDSKISNENAPSKPAIELRKVQLLHYEFSVMPDYEIEDISPKMSDFALFRIYKKGSSQTIARIYLGNHPKFPAYQWSEAAKLMRKENCLWTEYVYSSQNKSIEGLIQCEGLSYRNRPTPYALLHYFSNSLDGESAEALKKIIDSVKVIRPNLE